MVSAKHIIFLGIFGLLCSSAFAAAPKWADLERLVSQEKYAEAKNVAEKISQDSKASIEDRAKAVSVYGRVLLSLQLKEEARAYLKMVSKKGSNQIEAPLLDVYSAWLKALDKPDEGIKQLEKIIASDKQSIYCAEACDALAIALMRKGDWDKAKVTVARGQAALQYRGIKDGFIVHLLANRLNSDLTSGDARKMFLAGEQLREKGKFNEALQVFRRL